ncbi:hypothetical protein ACTA71_011168, partial [Dictyostelium dimigraforme]
IQNNPNQLIGLM